MNAPHEEAVEFAKVSKRENRVYVGNLSYDVKYRDLMEFMRGGGWGNILVFGFWGVWRGVVDVSGGECGRGRLVTREEVLVPAPPSRYPLRRSAGANWQEDERRRRVEASTFGSFGREERWTGY